MLFVLMHAADTCREVATLAVLAVSTAVLYWTVTESVV
jgi:hypothetical protein